MAYERELLAASNRDDGGDGGDGDDDGDAVQL